MHATVSNLTESDIEPYSTVNTHLYISVIYFARQQLLTRTVVLESGGLLCRTAYHLPDTMSIPYTEKSSTFGIKNSIFPYWEVTKAHLTVSKAPINTVL